MTRVYYRQESKKEAHYYWVVVPQMYLATALLLTRKACPDKRFLRETSTKSICDDLGFRSAHPNYELIWPIVFNLKHGIELWLKGLGNMDYGKYSNTHDLKGLFNEAVTNSGKNKKVLRKLRTNMWPIIKKYYYGTYDPTRKDERHPDKQNEAERFPERLRQKKRGGGRYRIREPYIWVTCNIMDSIANDIEKIERSFAEAQRAIVPMENFDYSK